MASEDAQGLRRYNAREVLTVDEEFDDGSPSSGCGVEPAMLVGFGWLGRSCPHNDPEEREVVARPVRLPAGRRTIRG